MPGNFGEDQCDPKYAPHMWQDESREAKNRRETGDYLERYLPEGSVKRGEWFTSPADFRYRWQSDKASVAAQFAESIWDSQLDKDIGVLSFSG